MRTADRPSCSSTQSEMTDSVSSNDSPTSASSQGSGNSKPEKKIKYFRERIAVLNEKLGELTRSNIEYQHRLTSIPGAKSTEGGESPCPSPSPTFAADSQRGRELAAWLEEQRQQDRKKHAAELNELRDRNRELLEVVQSFPDDGRRLLVVENHNLHAQLADLKTENANSAKALEEKIADHSVLEFRYRNRTWELGAAIEAARSGEERIRALTLAYDRLIRQYHELLGVALEGEDDEDGGVGDEEEEAKRPVLRVVNGD